MECVWVCLEEDRILSTSRISLGPSSDGHKVYFGQDKAAKGTWFFLESNGVMIIEFSATSNKWMPLKRHALQKMRDDEFQLLPADHEVYSDDQHIWSKKSVVHYNTKPVVMKVLNTVRMHEEALHFRPAV